MNRFQDVWSKLAKGIESWQINQFQNVWGECADGDEGSTGNRSSQTDSQAEVQDDTTVMAAAAVSEGLFGHKLTPSQKKVGGTAVHYFLGTGVGGLYGATAEIVPHVTEGAGLPFGAVFWLVVDEGAVPLLRLSKGPTAYPLSTHAYALSSHFVYGLTAEIVRRAVRKAI
jgi:hypothetical protein